MDSNQDLDQLLDAVTSELLEGIEKKDKTMVLDAIRCLIHGCMDEDMENPE